MSFKQYCKELLSHYKEIVSTDGRNIVTDGYIIISTPEGEIHFVLAGANT